MKNPAEKTPARWEGLPGWLLAQTAGHAHRLVGDGFSSVGGRGYHYRLLATLEDFGPASQAALGRRSGIHLSDMVATINELADRGLVERSPDPSDRRRNIISWLRLRQSLTCRARAPEVAGSPHGRRADGGLHGEPGPSTVRRLSPAAWVPAVSVAGTRPLSAFGLGGQPFRLCVQCLDEDELHEEIFVNEADQNIHRASLTT